MRSTLLVSALTMASRLLGLVREQLFAALLGAGFFADAFVVAFRIPNLLRDLFAEGALSAAFVPTFTQVETEKGKQAAHELANKVVGALLVLVGALTLLGIVFAKPLVWALAAGFAKEPGKIELTAYLAQLMMPFLLLLSLAAVMMGMLNARGRFGAPAIAPALFNVAAIGVGAGLKLAGCSPETAVVGWSLGTLLGGLLQFGVQVPQVWRDGYRLWPRFSGLWGDPAIRRIARLMAPATIGLAAVQVNIFINTQFASGEPGANAWLNYAFRLMYLPIGIFGVAIATVTASSLARHAANKDVGQVRAGLAQGLRHVAFLTVPSTVGLVVLAQPIIALIYEHGRFKATDTAATAVALMGYSVGLYAYSGVKVAAPAFYALDRSRVPLVASACAVATNLVLNALAHRYLGYVGLALGTSLGAMVNLLILTIAFRSLTRGADRGPGPGQGPGIGGQFAKVCLASVAMGAAVWGAVWAFDRAVGAGGGTSLQLVRVLGGVALGAGVYAAACKGLRVGEMDEVLAAVRRRRARRA
ncbi:MAG TPA: murein biosynthesis integral membrane protein MurJ [Myxococcales bacterium]|jgi:putative peptidoglycan lipid II flippase